MKVLVELSHRSLTNISLTLFAGLDSSMDAVVQNLQVDLYSLSAVNTLPLQTRVREVANQGEDVLGFQMFSVLEQRDAQ